MKLNFIVVGTLIRKPVIFGVQKIQTWFYRNQCIHYEWLFYVVCGAEGSLTHISLKLRTTQPLRPLHHDNRFFCTRLLWYWCELSLVSTGWCNLTHISCHNQFIASNIWWPFNKRKWWWQLVGQKFRFDTIRLFSQQISGKNSESTKPAMKKFLKNLSFGVDVKL